MVTNTVTWPAAPKLLLVDIGGTNVRTCSANINSNILINPQKENTSCLKSFDDLPSIEYAAKVQGLPQKPIKGIFFGRADLILLTAL